MKNKKYKMTSETKTVKDSNGNSIILHRIVALRDIGELKTGTAGGWIEKERNLSQDGNCFVYDDACVYGNAYVSGNAVISVRASVSGDAEICHHAAVTDNACVSGYAMLHDSATVSGRAAVMENAEIAQNALVSGDVVVFSDAFIYGDVKINSSEKIGGNASIYDPWHVYHVNGRITAYRGRDDVWMVCVDDECMTMTDYCFRYHPGCMNQDRENKNEKI